MKTKDVIINVPEDLPEGVVSLIWQTGQNIINNLNKGSCSIVFPLIEQIEENERLKVGQYDMFVKEAKDIEMVLRLAEKITNLNVESETKSSDPAVTPLTITASLKKQETFNHIQNEYSK